MQYTSLGAAYRTAQRVEQEAGVRPARSSACQPGDLPLRTARLPPPSPGLVQCTPARSIHAVPGPILLSLGEGFLQAPPSPGNPGLLSPPWLGLSDGRSLRGVSPLSLLQGGLGGRHPALSPSAGERGFVSHQDSKWGAFPQCRKKDGTCAGLCYVWR